MTVREEYDKRIEEIDSFYEILNIIELDRPRLVAFEIKEGIVSKNLLKIDAKKNDLLRSTTYLLLYNLIESTIYSSIVSIFDKIKDDGLKYFDVIEHVQKYWVNNIYKYDDKKKKETIVKTIMNVSTMIFNNTITLVSNEIAYGGSLDGSRIIDTAESMKIDISNVHKVYQKEYHGPVLVDIKKKRNWLALIESRL